MINYAKPKKLACRAASVERKAKLMLQVADGINSDTLDQITQGVVVPAKGGWWKLVNCNLKDKNVNRMRLEIKETIQELQNITEARNKRECCKYSVVSQAAPIVGEKQS